MQKEPSFASYALVSYRENTPALQQRCGLNLGPCGDSVLGIAVMACACQGADGVMMRVGERFLEPFGRFVGSGRREVFQQRYLTALSH